MKKLLIGISLIGLVGCKSTMPEYYYDKYSTQYVGTGLCYKKDLISATEYGKYTNAIKYAVTSWKFDENKINNKIKKWSNSSVTEQYCKNLKGDLESLIDQIKYQPTVVTQPTNLQDAFPKPIFCNTVGSVTMCN